MKDNMGALTGSHASCEARSDLRPPGFDPARLRELADRCRTATWADPALAREVGEATKPFRVRPDWNPLAWLDEAKTLWPGDIPHLIPSDARVATAMALYALASGMEAGTVETEGLDAKHDSPTLEEGDAR